MLKCLKILCFYILLPALSAGFVFTRIFPDSVNVEAIAGITDHVALSVTAETVTQIKKPVVSIDVATKDFRAVVLDKYFSSYSSPLSGFGSFFVAMCDKYQLPGDCTLMPAIAYAETKLCTKSISADQHNCWGWGGPGIYRTVYPGYKAAIEDIAKNLHSGYGLILKRPDLMAAHYCGSNCGNWISSVTTQQKAINNLSKSLGFPALF